MAAALALSVARAPEARLASYLKGKPFPSMGLRQSGHGLETRKPSSSAQTSHRHWCQQGRLRRAQSGDEREECDEGA